MGRGQTRAMLGLTQEEIDMDVRGLFRTLEVGIGIYWRIVLAGETLS